MINLPAEKLIAFCKRYPIRRLSLFGSALRDDFSDESDIDLLVEYELDAKITLLDMAAQELELTEIVGRKVDLRTPEDLSRYFRQQVLESAKLLYDRTRAEQPYSS